MHMQRSTPADDACHFFVGGDVQRECTTQGMSNEEHDITALFEQLQFLGHRLRPVFPAKRHHFAYMHTVSRQQHVGSDHAICLKRSLYLSHIALAAVQSVYK